MVVSPAPPDSVVKDTVVKDMGYSREEFLRALPAAFRGTAYRVDGTTVEIGDAGRGVTIHLRDLPPRLLGGLMKLSRIEVTLRFRGHGPEERRSFLASFDRAYQRGGG